MTTVTSPPAVLCIQSRRLSATCDTCGAHPAVLHLPEEVHGWYCPRCCPVCHSQQKAA
jgi:hypothetical protein